MKLRGIVWKRIDFRETSRVVTLITRERGRIRVLSKGAHRPRSITLGKIDLFNRVQVTLSGRAMPILGRCQLDHEPRALREPKRFLAANYIAELCDRALIDDRADAELFDLIDGGLSLLELAPIDRLVTMIAGIELRLLHTLGLLPSLSRCTQCGTTLDASARMGTTQIGLFCRAHAPHGSIAIPAGALGWLEQLARTPGRYWPRMDVPRQSSSSLGILARWVTDGLESRFKSRDHALRAQ